MLVEGLYTLLTSDPGVQAVLGSPAARSDKRTGMFPNIAPDEVTTPYIVYLQVARNVIMSYQGVNRLQETRVQFSCYGASYIAAKQLAKAVENVLDSFTGKLTDSQGTVVENTLTLSEHDEAETDLKATVYAVHLDYAFWATS